MKYSPEQLASNIRDEFAIAKRLGPLAIGEEHMNIGLVWAVSSTGTVKEAADLGPDNPYTGVKFDLGIVDEGVRIIRDITARRLEKHPEKVTRGDIERNGPSMLYNGEYPGMLGNKFPNQIPDFLEYAGQEDFLVPGSNVIIGKIDAPNTPAQVKDLAGLLHKQPKLRRYSAVVGLGHSIRTGRYIQHAENAGIMPEGAEVIPAFLAQAGRDDRIAELETGKAQQYYEMGHLAGDSAFFKNQ